MRVPMWTGFLHFLLLYLNLIVESSEVEGVVWKLAKAVPDCVEGRKRGRSKLM